VSAHPDASLHLRSFPTRRSSDLRYTTTRTQGCPVCVAAVNVRKTRDEQPTDLQTRHLDAFVSHGSAAPMLIRCLEPCDTNASRRSEEHTSELQSRSDLVCRLLLE